jgi:hypothetical protein
MQPVIIFLHVVWRLVELLLSAEDVVVPGAGSVVKNIVQSIMIL